MINDVCRFVIILFLWTCKALHFYLYERDTECEKFNMTLVKNTPYNVKEKRKSPERLNKMVEA